MAFGLPKPAELKALFDAKFGELIAKLDEMLAELRLIREQVSQR
jgi:hypothetical protein